MTYEERFKLRREFDMLVREHLTEETAAQMLEIIAAIGPRDDEVAHIMERELWRAALMTIDHPLAWTALKTEQIEFSRWFA